MNYYQILGIEKNATTKEIKKHYYQLAKKYHPDKNKGDLQKCEEFKLLSEAYTTLSNPKKRFIYDLKSQININYNFELNDEDCELLHSYYNKIMNWTEIKFIKLLFLSLPEEFRITIKEKMNQFFTLKKDILIDVREIKYINLKELYHDYYINLFRSFGDIYNQENKQLIVVTDTNSFHIFITSFDYAIKIRNNNHNVQLNIVANIQPFKYRNYKLIYHQPINLYQYYYGDNFSLIINNQEVSHVNNFSENTVIQNYGLYNPLIKKRDDLIIKYDLNLHTINLIQNKEGIRQIFNL